MTLNELSKSWNNFWFKPTSLNVISLYRIFLGMAAFIWGLGLAPELLIWFGNYGILSTKTLTDPNFGSRTLINPIVTFNLNDSAIVALLWIYLVAALCLTLGFWTRVSAVTTWLLMTSFDSRNPFILSGGDALLCLSLFVLMFTPSGKMFSIDSWLSRRSNLQQAHANTYEPWTLRLLQLQLAILYWEAFYGKVKGQDWWDGTAVYYVTHISEFKLLPVPWIFDQLWTCKLLTWGTLIFEMFMWSLIWFKPVRYWLLAAGLIFHLGLNWALDIPIFQFVVLVNYIVFLDSVDVQKVLVWIQKCFNFIITRTLHLASPPAETL